jgi:tripartite-type tricarboxylate transporter receptor subunit TctC
MNQKLNHLVGTLACVLMLCPVALCAQGLAPGATFPAKPIRIVAPFPPGGPVDLLARLIGEKLQVRWGQPVIVENKPGAGGNIGIKAVADAAPDGYTLLLVPAGNITINATLMKDMPFNWERDFAAVTKIATAPNILAVNPAVKAANVPELIALARSQPGKLSFGSPGIGSGLHLAGELFRGGGRVAGGAAPAPGRPGAGGAVSDRERHHKFCLRPHHH